MDFFPNPERPKPKLLRVGKSEYQFPAAAAEIQILNERGQTLWQKSRQSVTGPIRWQGVDAQGKVLEAGDYVCKLIYPDGEAVYIPFVFSK